MPHCDHIVSCIFTPHSTRFFIWIKILYDWIKYCDTERLKFIKAYLREKMFNLANFGITLGSAATLTSTSLSSSSIRISISLMSFLPNKRIVICFHAEVANIPIFFLSIFYIPIFRMGRWRWRFKNDRFNVHLLCYHHLVSGNQRICISSSPEKVFVFTLDCGLLPPP